MEAIAHVPATLGDVAAAIDRLTNAIVDASTPPPVSLAERRCYWADVELYGHRRHIGRVEEVEIARRGFLSVRPLTVQAGDDGPLLGAAILYAPTAVFSLTELDEQAARELWADVYLRPF